MSSTVELLIHMKGRCVSFISFNNRNYTTLRAVLCECKINVDMRLRYYFKTFEQMARIGGKMYLEIERCSLDFNNEENKEIRMTKRDDSYGIPLDVSIGQLEVTLQDLLDFKQGHCIIGKLPASHFVTLSIAGEPIANATFEVEGDMVVLKIDDVYVNEGSISNDNQGEHELCL